ncbi:hypothetical protein D3C77_654670 [compost metagenome]
MQHITGAILAHRLQPRAIEQLAQRLVGGVAALQAGRLRALGHLRGARQRDAGLACELIQHLVQRAGGDVVLLAGAARRFGHHYHRHAGQAKRGTEQCGAHRLAQA